jgi:excisionase family DNA binding protein
MTSTKHYYSKNELSEELGVSIRTIDNWISCGIISYSKIGRRVIFSRADIEEFVQRNKHEALHEQNSRSTRYW